MPRGKYLRAAGAMPAVRTAGNRTLAVVPSPHLRRLVRRQPLEERLGRKIMVEDRGHHADQQPSQRGGQTDRIVFRHHQPLLRQLSKSPDFLGKVLVEGQAKASLEVPFVDDAVAV